MPLDPHRERREQLDEEIAQLEARLLTLRLARNDLAPITRLHTELLQEIFDITQQLADETDERDGGVALKISWVCHRWREIAHGTSSLWRFIDLSHPDWVETAVSRAKGQDLEFYLDNLDAHLDRSSVKIERSLVRLCLGNLSRIRQLHIAIEENGHGAVIFPPQAPEWLIPAPILTRLNLQKMVVPTNIFSGICPSLQWLTLAGCTLDWDSMPMIPGLKGLSITEPRPKVIIGKILDIYCIVGPTLESLELSDLINNDPQSGPVNVERVQFKKLDILLLKEPHPEMVAHLLAHISLPTRTSIEILVQHNWDASGDEVIEALKSSRNLPKWPISSLEIKASEQQALLRIEEQWPTAAVDGDVAHVTCGENPWVTHIELEVYMSEPSEIISTLRQLPIHPILQVVFSPLLLSGSTPTEFIHYVATLGTVQCLNVQSRCLQGFCEYIGSKASQAWSEIDARFSDTTKIAKVQNILGFSNLQELHISGVGCGSAMLKALRDWLLCRMMVSIPLGKLYFSKMDVPSLKWIEDSLTHLVSQLEMVDMTEKAVNTELA